MTWKFSSCSLPKIRNDQEIRGVGHPLGSMQNQFRFSLLGSHIELRSNSDLAYMEQVFHHLEHKIALTQDTLRLNDSLKIAIITAFLLVDDLLSERAECAKLLPYEEGLEAENLINGLLQELQELCKLDK